MSNNSLIDSFEDFPESPSFSFLKIDHKNTMYEEDEDSRIKQTLNFFTAITSIDGEDSIGKEINKFFNRILPENSTNFLTLNKAIAVKNKIIFSRIQNSLDRILNKKPSIEFFFSKNEIEDIVNILTFSYKNITKDIKSFSDLAKIVDQISKSGIDFFKRYEVRGWSIPENNENKSNNNSTNQLPVHSTNTSPKRRSKKIGSSTLLKKELSKSIDNIGFKNEINGSVYKYIPGKKGEFIIPIEMIILTKKFQTVRKIKLGITEFTPGKKKTSLTNEDYSTIRNFIFVFLNVEWLFPNVIEIEVDLSNENLYLDLSQVFHEKMIELAKKSNKILKNTKYDTGYNTKRNFNPRISTDEEIQFYESEEDNLSGDSMSSMGLVMIEDPPVKKEKPSSYDELVLQYRETYEIIIVFSYFISTIKNLCVANMIIPDCFKREILTCFIQNKVLLVNYNFFSFFSRISNLVQFTIDVNCLDMATFENLIGFIFKNSNLKILQLSFFPPEEYFSPQMLLKLLYSSGLNINTIFPQKENNVLSNDNQETEDVDQIIINKLLEGFEDNLSKFFSLLEKSKLNEIVLLLDLPSIIYNNEKYTIVLLKFFINLFLLLKRKDNTLEILTILASYLLFDNRKYPMIYDLFNLLPVFQNPQIKLKKFTFHAKFFNLPNLYRIIPYNIRYFSLGDLDLESFTSVIKYITSKKFKSHSQLESLHIILSNTIVSLNLVINHISTILTHYPKSLKEITISTWITTSSEQIKDIIVPTNYNTLEKIILEFGKITDREKRGSRDSFSSGGSSVLSNQGKEKITDSYYIVRTRRKTNVILRLMNHFKKKNSNFMKFKIFLTLEKFINPSRPKEVKIKQK